MSVFVRKIAKFSDSELLKKEIAIEIQHSVVPIGDDDGPGDRREPSADHVGHIR